MKPEPSTERPVLVVDDDEVLLRAYRRSARRSELIVESDPANALEIARLRRPAVAILDVYMPAMSGLELMRAMKADDPQLQVVLVSAHMTIDLAQACVRAGADDVMNKPVTIDEVIARLARDTPTTPRDTPATTTAARAAWEHEQRVLKDCGGNRSDAARRLGIPRYTLQRHLKTRAPKS